MGDWDPFDSPEDNPTDTKSAETHYEEGIGHVFSRDWQKCGEHIWKVLLTEKPWERMPDPKPDLSWHKPTCTLEAWKHAAMTCDLATGIARFTLNQPERGNRLEGDVLSALADAVVLLHSRQDIRLAVFTGKGKLLCAGGEATGQEAAKQACLWQALATAPQFTVCIANGSAMGDGMGLVGCCDFTMALAGTYFSLADIRSGLVPATVAPYVLAKTGTGVAKRLFCTCENLSADRAVTEGLLDEVVSDMEEASQKVSSLSTQLTSCGPRSVEAAKELVLGVAGQQIIEPLMFYTSMMAQRSASSPEAKAAVTAVKAGRPKPWEETPIGSLN